MVSSLKIRTKLLVGLAGLGLALGFCLSPWGRTVDQLAYDSLFLVRGSLEPPPGLVVVAIDEPTFGVLGLQWPWPRSIHARLIDRLLAQGAAAVALDIVFAEPSAAEE
ncbi:MAG: CHASE2 domain-containing protein, partial [Deltaproteobacteria bacterium]|nr:CHASE2 domain-containing protein [Deltaproteobacteria bacterium]